LPSSRSHQYGCGSALMSPCPRFIDGSRHRARPLLVGRRNNFEAVVDGNIETSAAQHWDKPTPRIRLNSARETRPEARPSDRGFAYRYNV
jgi:hypothetical protein